MNKPQSLNKRFGVKLFANIVGFAISIVTQALIPRGLGPKAYGDFSYLSNVFAQLMGFVDMGTSIAFYTKLSQRQKDTGLITFYFGFSLIVSITVFLIVYIVSHTSIRGALWPNQLMKFVYMAVIWAVLSWFIQTLNKIVDAYGLTVPAEIARIGQKIIGVVLIVGMFLSDQLTLSNYFVYHYVILLTIGLSFIWIIKKHRASIFTHWGVSKPGVIGYLKEFYQYSSPLFIYALVGLFVGILDRWLLQVFSGSVQQGFYGLSYQIGAICFLFSSAMAPLITREFSIAFADKDLAKMRHLFRRYIPMLYTITAYFACFIAAQADKVTLIMGGGNFEGATMAVSIMAFYPVHQTYGQLSSAVFYATGQTVLYRNIGIIFMLLGLPLTYLLIAPADQMGMNAGATGLAIKMVVIQFTAVNVQLYFNSKLLKLSFLRYLTHQGLSLTILVIIAYTAKFVMDTLIPLESRVSFNFIVSGLLYTLLVAVCTIMVPQLFGVSRNDLVSIMMKIKTYFQVDRNNR